MENLELKYIPLKTFNFKPQQTPQNGFITLCRFCGELIGNKSMYCRAHGTQEGWKKDFEMEIEVLREAKARGRNLPVSINNWK